MRLVLVHGIHQQGKDPAKLKQTWLEDLEKGLQEPGALADVEVEMPFYGDILVAAMARGPTGAIAQGPSADDDRDMAEFLAAGLAEQAAAANIGPDAIRAEQERLAGEAALAIAVEQGFPVSRRINAIVSLLEKVSPWRGDLAVRLLSQAYEYLRKPHVSAAVDAAVKPVLSRGPMVLVTHSLGTVVSFKLLRDLAGAGVPTQVPLYVTCGSPLTLATVQRALQPPFATPSGIGRWLNVRDRDDFISLDRALTPPLYPGPIDNRDDFENPGHDAHAIPGYLSYEPLARAVLGALRA